MAGITQEQAQTNLDALLAAQAAFTGRSKVTVQTSAGSRAVEYTSLLDMITAINYWSRILASLERQAAGHSRHGARLADFR